MKTVLDKATPIMAATLLSTAVFSATSIQTSAHEAGDIIIRAGLTTVAPDVDSSTVTVATVGDVGMRVDVDDSSALGLNLVYMFNETWGVELLAATPFSHDITLEDTGDNSLGLGDGKLGKTKHLPPTLSALYYFPIEGNFQPYAGLGLNYTTFFDDHFAGRRRAQTFGDLDLDDSIGVAAQLGFDLDFDNGWLLNASLRYIEIETDASFRVLDLDGEVSVTLDPWVYSVMLGRKF